MFSLGYIQKWQDPAPADFVCLVHSTQETFTCLEMEPVWKENSAEEVCTHVCKQLIHKRRSIYGNVTRFFEIFIQYLLLSFADFIS